MQNERQNALERIASAAGDLVTLEDIVMEFSTDHEIALAAVLQNGHALCAVSEAFKSDYDIVLAAVSQQGWALQSASEEMRGNRQVVLAAVSQNGKGQVLGQAAEELRSDHEIVLAAVSSYGQALDYAADALKSNQEIVLAAVSNQGWAIQYAADSLKDDRRVVAAAVAQETTTLQAASDRLLEDESFAVDARRSFYFFRIIASGRSCVLLVHIGEGDEVNNDDYLLRESCSRLGVPHSSDAALLYGTEAVPKESPLRDWPGPPSIGIAIEYQLVGSKRARIE